MAKAMWIHGFRDFFLLPDFASVALSSSVIDDRSLSGWCSALFRLKSLVGSARWAPALSILLGSFDGGFGYRRWNLGQLAIGDS